MSAPDVSAALTVNSPGPDSRLAGVSTAAIRRELRRRKLTSGSRDVKANPGNLNGVHKPLDECAAAVRRQVLAYGRRIVAEGDAEALPALAALHAAVEEATGTACRALVASGRYSWAEVAASLGRGRQAVWDGYHAEDGTRRRRGTQLRAGSRP